MSFSKGSGRNGRFLALKGVLLRNGSMPQNVAFFCSAGVATKTIGPEKAFVAALHYGRAFWHRTFLPSGFCSLLIREGVVSNNGFAKVSGQ